MIPCEISSKISLTYLSYRFKIIIKNVNESVYKFLSFYTKIGYIDSPRITLFSLFKSKCFFSAIGRKPVRTSNGMSEWLPSSHLRAIPHVVDESTK